MDTETLRAHCLGKKGAVEDYPFGENTLVFKVMGKMFALMPARPQPGSAQWINLKCDPTLAQILRQTYAAVRPGYHMNKKHWNTVEIDGTIPDDEIFEMIDNSYDLVVQGLKKVDRQKLGRE